MLVKIEYQKRREWSYEPPNFGNIGKIINIEDHNKFVSRALIEILIDGKIKKFTTTIYSAERPKKSLEARLAKGYKIGRYDGVSIEYIGKLDFQSEIMRQKRLDWNITIQKV